MGYERMRDERTDKRPVNVGFVSKIDETPIIVPKVLPRYVQMYFIVC